MESKEEELLFALFGDNLEKIKGIIFEKPELINKRFATPGIETNSPLMFTCSIISSLGIRQRRKYDIINFLLLLGANVNQKNENGSTALQILINNVQLLSKSELIRIIDLLLKYGADINTKDKNGFNLLHTLIFVMRKSDNPKDILEIVEILVKKGINVYEKDKYGRTAIHFAFESMKDSIYKNFVMEYLADIIIIILKYNDCFEIIDELLPKNMGLIEKIRTYRLKREIENLKRENEELRYKPGNPGYLEAMEEFDALKKNEK